MTYNISKNKLGDWLERFIILSWFNKLSVSIWHKPTKSWKSVVSVKGNKIGLVDGDIYTPRTNTRVRLSC